MKSIISVEEEYGGDDNYVDRYYPYMYDYGR